MKWTSNEYTALKYKQLEHFLPEDFDFRTYISLNQDLIDADIDTETKAKEHYILHGRLENRTYKLPQSITISQAININKPEFWNNGKNLIYFAPTAPDYDCSSGGNRLLQILKILSIELNYNVWFMCNGYSHIKHINEVRNLGIKVFLPNLQKQEYLNIYIEQAYKRGIIFDNAIFSWYDIGNQYIEIVKNYYPNIKILVDSVDIHWLREQRGKDANILNINQKNLTVRKELEKNAYSLADTIFTVTENDKYHVQKELGYGNNIKILSNIHDKRNISLGDNILFIGNYSHKPNIDCVVNCIEIYKEFQNTIVYSKLKIKPKLLIAGPNLNKKIQDSIKTSNNIEYLGQIENLTELYSQSRLLLAPLSWGAGIKGKICDCSMAGIPILTSNIGNEGINFIDRQHCLIANSNQEYVEKLIYFFSMNESKQIILGQQGQDHIDKIVSRKSATNIIKHSLQDKHIVLSIVTYKQTKKLIKCIESILNKTKYNNYTIVITDNSPDNNTNIKIQKYIKKYSNKIEYIKNNTNKYFIDPNNRIMKDTKYIESDIVLINDDLEIVDNYWLNYLYSSAYSADYIAAAGGKTIYPNGKLAEAGAELYNDGYGRNKGRNEDPNNPIYNIPHYTGYCSGCLLYMRRDAIDTIGVFSDQLEKMYYEDSEWQYRAHIKGLKTIYDHRCVAIHDEGSSSGNDITKGTKKYQETNRINFLNIMKDLGYSNNIEIFN